MSFCEAMLTLSLYHLISLCFQGAALPLQNLFMSSLHYKVNTGIHGFTEPISECIIASHEEDSDKPTVVVSAQITTSDRAEDA